MKIKEKCKHEKLIKINHWWYNFKCEYCGEKFRWIPKGEYFYLVDDENKKDLFV